MHPDQRGQLCFATPRCTRSYRRLRIDPDPQPAHRMLVLSRKVNENIVIDGRIVVKVVRTEGNFVKLGIEAPADVPVHRQEVYDEIQRNNQAALSHGRPATRPPAGPKPVKPGGGNPSQSNPSTGGTA